MKMRVSWAHGDKCLRQAISDSPSWPLSASRPSDWQSQYPAYEILITPRSTPNSGRIQSMKLGELASYLGAELQGDPEIEVTGVKGIEEAGAHDVTFVANPRYTGLARQTAAAAVLVELDFPSISAATLRLKNPYHAFSRTLALFYQQPVYAPGIHPTAVIDPTAIVGPGAHIGAYVVIGEGVQLGSEATLLPHVVLYPNVVAGSHFFAHAHSVVREGCLLGDHVTLENGAIIGADGFGFAKNELGRWEKIPQSGPTRLGNYVDVQANACIDRATIGETIIGDGTKVDNLVQVGHGSHIGQNSLVCAQAGLAGSSVVGNDVILAGQVGIAGHCSIGDRVILTAQSGVSHDVPAGKMLSGSPAFDNRIWLRAVLLFQRLPELLKRLDHVEKALLRTPHPDEPELQPATVPAPVQSPEAASQNLAAAALNSAATSICSPDQPHSATPRRKQAS